MQNVSGQMQKALEFAKKHEGHKCTYKLGGEKFEGVIERISFDPRIKAVAIWIENKPHFPKRIYLNNIWECSCQEKTK